MLPILKEKKIIVMLKNVNESITDVCAVCTVLILNACVSCMHESCRDHVKTGCKYCELVLLNC